VPAMNSMLSLFGVMGLIYLTDCVTWIKTRSFVFIFRFNRNWKTLDATPAFKTPVTGIRLLNPLPPLGKIYCCRLPALALAPIGIRPMDDSADPPAKLTYKAIRDLEVKGREIRINARRFCLCSDSVQAERIGGLVRAVWKASAQNREGLIRAFWKNAFDEQAARARLTQAAKPLGSLLFLCNGLFIYLFVFSPLVVLVLGLPRLLIPLAAGMLALALQIAYAYFKLHKKLYREAGEDRIGNVIKMAVCPPVAVRACDLITPDLLSDYHPLVVAHLLLTSDAYETFCQGTLRRLRYPLKTETEAEADDISIWQNGALLTLITEYIKHTTKIMDRTDVLPVPDQPENRAYCPRCLAQFTRSQGDCSDCPGIPLQPFAKMRKISAIRE